MQRYSQQGCRGRKVPGAKQPCGLVRDRHPPPVERGGHELDPSAQELRVAGEVGRDAGPEGEEEGGRGWSKHWP